MLLRAEGSAAAQAMHRFRIAEKCFLPDGHPGRWSTPPHLHGAALLKQALISSLHFSPIDPLSGVAATHLREIGLGFN